MWLKKRIPKCRGETVAQKRTISAKQVLSDIHGGMTDDQLKEKYSLSTQSLQTLFKKLLDAGLIAHSELATRSDLQSLQPSTGIGDHDSPESKPSKRPRNKRDKSRSAPQRAVKNKKSQAVVSTPSLLSDYAERCFRSEQESGSFWKNLSRSLNLAKPTVNQGNVNGDQSESYYRADGYEPFCQIDQLKILVKVGGNALLPTVLFVLIADSVPVDIFYVADGLSDEALPPDWLLMLIFQTYGLRRSGTFGDNAEAAVTALTNCFQLNTDALARIRIRVYQGFVATSIADRILDSGEKEFLNRVQSTLRISPDETKSSAYEALQQLYGKASEFQNLSEQDAIEFSQLATNLGLPAAAAADLSSQLLAKSCQKLLEAPKLDRKHLTKFMKLADSLKLSPSDITGLTERLLAKASKDLQEAKDTITDKDISHIQSLGKLLGLDASQVAPHTYQLELRVFYQECLAGRIPVLSSVSVNLKRREEAYFESEVSVVQQKTRTVTHRAYGGTRVKIGKMPIYLGGSTPVRTSHEEMVQVGQGRFILTNQRVMLVGTKINYSIPITKINDIEVFGDALQILNEGRFAGRFYFLPTSDDIIRAAMIIQALTGGSGGE